MRPRELSPRARSPVSSVSPRRLFLNTRRAPGKTWRLDLIKVAAVLRLPPIPGAPLRSLIRSAVRTVRIYGRASSDDPVERLLGGCSDLRYPHVVQGESHEHEIVHGASLVFL